MLNLLVNPIAGGKRGKRMIKNLSRIEGRLNKLGVAYTVYKTEKRGDATELTKKIIADGADNVIVVGGDGTLHEVINGFSDFDRVTLGIIPCGTGNDFATSLKIPEDPIKALDIILKNTPAFVDYMQMPTVRGLNIVGMGIDVEVLKLYEECKIKTKITYTKCLLKALLGFKCVQFDASFDGGEPQRYSSFTACIANGYRYGGGIPICPVADPTDKQMDFVAVSGMGKLKTAAAVVKLKAGKILSVKESTHGNMKTVTVTPATEHYTVNVDGELYEDIPFSVTLVSDTLRVFLK